MSLKLKMSLGIASIMLLVIVGYALVTLRAQADRLLEVSRGEAELIAAVAERAIARAMVQGKSEEVRAILGEISEMPDMAGLQIWITDWRGETLRPSRPPRPDGAERAVAVSRAILNGPACHGCHPAGVTTLGVLGVRLFFPSIRAQILDQWASILLPATLALVAAGGLIAGYVALAMGRRLDRLSRAMSRVEGGDLTAKVPEDGPDELGRLGRNFNVMVARLADVHRQLEDRHAAAIRRAENLASLGKMAAGIAHEINNPLAGMQNCVRGLRKGPREHAQRVQYLEMLQDGLGRIGRIVGQLLNFAREAEPRLAPTRLPPVLDRCLALLEHEVAARGISCRVSAEAGLPPVLADPQQLEQVFLNILMNALEAMPEGGRLTVTAGVRSREPGQFLEVAVSDTGAGIPPENLSRVFDPFFTTKDVGEGTGLGLSVSYGIVQAHGGFIDVESEPGGGSTFTVALPVG